MEQVHLSHPNDSASLRMENELLEYENRHLAARLSTTNQRWQRRLARAEEKSDGLEQHIQSLNRRLAERDRRVSVLTERGARKTARLERERRQRRQVEVRLLETRADMDRLLTRLDGSIVGPLLRTRPGFRNLLAHYRGTGHR